MATPTFAQIALGDLDQELATTRRVLERVPDTQGDWKPHERSTALLPLAAHLANIPGLGLQILAADDFDFAKRPPQPPAATTRDEVLARFDENAANLRAAVAAADDDAMRATWTGRRGDVVMFAMPRAGALRGMVVNHLIHHRGQLSVYLRLRDVPVPSIYGPSADERGF